MLWMILVLLINYLVYSNCCPPNFELHQSLCVNVSDKVNGFCGASKSCYSIGGRLAFDTELDTIKSLLDGNPEFHVGITDLFQEGTWINTDGTPAKISKFWYKNEPNEAAGGQDCTYLDNRGLWDVGCSDNYSYVCVYDKIPVRTSTLFEKDEKNIFNDDRDSGCYETISSYSRIHCGIRCIADVSCKSFYYGEIGKQCVLVKYAKSTLPQSWDDDSQTWIGYHLPTP